MKGIDNFPGFEAAFRIKGRINNYSEDGLYALFQFLEEMYPDMYVDVVEICSSYCEFTDIDEYREWADDPSLSTRDIMRSHVFIEIPDSEGFIVNTKATNW